MLWDGRRERGLKWVCPRRHPLPSWHSEFGTFQSREGECGTATFVKSIGLVSEVSGTIRASHLTYSPTSVNKADTRLASPIAIPSLVASTLPFSPL